MTDLNSKKWIARVDTDSIAEECGIEAGDALLAINGEEVPDVFAYRTRITEEYLEVLVEKADGEEWLLEIEKDSDEDLGLTFCDGLMDDARSCRNKCVFCFIDQLPKGMRETLYFKDDDTRLSFLQGNYVTLTNMSDDDIRRVISYHLSPINVSVHVADPELRRFMLKNKNAGRILDQITLFADAGIDLNFQIVLCKGLNDGAKLDETIAALTRFMPRGRSLSVVPVGISRFRDTNKLHPLESFEQNDCAAVIGQIHAWQEKLLASHGSRFVFAADEFYLKAKIPMPHHTAYEDFPQIENGVGMIAMMQAEFDKVLSKLKIKKRLRDVTVVTGMAAADFIRALSHKLTEHVNGLTIRIAAIRNDFFGNEITVSGLLTGHDIIEQLRNTELGEVVLLPKNLLRSGEETLLDDLTLTDISEVLGVPVRAVDTTGEAFADAVLRL